MLFPSSDGSSVHSGRSEQDDQTPRRQGPQSAQVRREPTTRLVAGVQIDHTNAQHSGTGVVHGADTRKYSPRISDGETGHRPSRRKRLIAREKCRTVCGCRLDRGVTITEQLTADGRVGIAICQVLDHRVCRCRNCPLPIFLAEMGSTLSKLESS